MLTITPERLRNVTDRIFQAAGTPADLATDMADILVESNLVGHDSHGVIRIPAYVRSIKEGGIVPNARPEVISETSGSALVDGKYAFGHIAAAFGTEVAVRKAKESKAVVISIVRCNHIGRLGEWGSRAAAQDVIAIVTVGGFGGPGIAAPFGGAGLQHEPDQRGDAGLRLAGHAGRLRDDFDRRGEGPGRSGEGCPAASGL